MTYTRSLLALLLAASVAGCDALSMKEVELRATVSGPATLRVGDVHQYAATAVASPSSYLTSPDKQVTFEWSSSNKDVATVTATTQYLPGGLIAAPAGLVTAKATGQVVITATPRHMDNFATGPQIAGSITITIVQ